MVLINHPAGPGRVWWAEIGRGLVDPEIARLVDELLSDAEPEDTYRRMATWASE